MRKLVSILNPIYWTTAREVGEAVNGYTLTEGIFRRETQAEFATGKTGHSRCSSWGLEAAVSENPNWAGEILRMTHIARGLDSDGALLLDIALNGHVLQLPSQAEVSVKVN